MHKLILTINGPFGTHFLCKKSGLPQFSFETAPFLLPSSSVFTPLWSRRKKAVLVFTSYGSKSRGHQFGSAASGSKSENAHKKRELLGLALGFTYKALRRIRARSSIASGSAARKRSTASSGCGSCKDILPCHRRPLCRYSKNSRN